MRGMGHETFAERFVAAAETSFNGQDLASIMASYAEDASLELWSDGLYQRFEGPSEIRGAWELVFALFPRFQVRKSLHCADARSIVNEWTGSTDGRRSAYGLDLWKLDEAERVHAHRVVCFADVVDARSLQGRLRMVTREPGAILRATAAGAKPWR